MYLTIWVTSKCNLECKYCYEGKNKSSEMMEMETADRILKYIKQVNDPTELINITFHGGEPLLNFEIIKYIVDEIKKDFYNTSFELTTNGTFLNKEIADFLIDNFDNGISLSIDGNKLVHDSNRIYSSGQGTFDLVMNNLNTYFNRNIFEKISIRMTLTPNMVDYLFDSCMFLINKGFFTIITALDQEDNSWTDKKFESLRIQVQKIYEVSLKNNYNKNAINLSLLDWKNRKKGVCRISENRLVIDVNGELYPCIASVGDRSLEIGSIYSDPIYNKKQVECLRKMNEKDNYICNGCKHKEFCVSSRCKFVNKSHSGDFLTPSLIECAYQNMIVSLQKQLL